MRFSGKADGISADRWLTIQLHLERLRRRRFSYKGGGKIVAEVAGSFITADIGILPLYGEMKVFFPRLQSWKHWIE